MTVRECRHCGGRVEDRFRYCPWCAMPQRTKLVEFFPSHPEVGSDRRKALRVSRYFGTDERPAQVRFSIWNGEQADAAVSLTEDDAARAAAFIGVVSRRRPLITQLREALRL